MIRFSGFLRFSLVVALAFGLGACKTVGGWFGDDKEPKTETLPVEALYAEAKESLNEGEYTRAQKYYSRLVARFPYGPYSEQAQLELAYVLYKTGHQEDATAAVDRFIRTYPRHPHIDYAYYLKGVINFDRDVTVLTRLARLDISARDLTGPTQSFNDFNEVLSRFPHSRYAPDARQRMVYLRNQLARSDLNVGLYYLRRGAYLAAANRGKFIVENYPQSEFDGDAIALMASAYAALGEQQLANDARRVLALNYPQHPYLTGSWPTGRSLWRQLNPFSGELQAP